MARRKSEFFLAILPYYRHTANAQKSHSKKHILDNPELQNMT